MKLGELIILIKRFYDNRGITEEKNRPRFNALEKIIVFYKDLSKNNNPEIEELFKYNKEMHKALYEKVLNKKLNGAENQVFNDLFKVYSMINTDEKY